jgi:hypothetical protein
LFLSEAYASLKTQDSYSNDVEFISYVCCKGDGRCIHQPYCSKGDMHVLAVSQAALGFYLCKTNKRKNKNTRNTDVSVLQIIRHFDFSRNIIFIMYQDTIEVLYAH